MVFVLDNYDSFTYNLVQYLGELGAEVVVRRNDEVTPQEVEAMRPDGTWRGRRRYSAFVSATRRSAKRSAAK
jgi:hypothetical protein